MKKLSPKNKAEKKNPVFSCLCSLPMIFTIFICFPLPSYCCSSSPTLDFFACCRRCWSCRTTSVSIAIASHCLLHRNRTSPLCFFLFFMHPNRQGKPLLRGPLLALSASNSYQQPSCNAPIPSWTPTIHKSTHFIPLLSTNVLYSFSK